MRADEHDADNCSCCESSTALLSVPSETLRDRTNTIAMPEDSGCPTYRYPYVRKGKLGIR